MLIQGRCAGEELRTVELLSLVIRWNRSYQQCISCLQGCMLYLFMEAAAVSEVVGGGGGRIRIRDFPGLESRMHTSLHCEIIYEVTIKPRVMSKDFSVLVMTKPNLGERLLTWSST